MEGKCQSEFVDAHQETMPCNRQAVTFCRECGLELCSHCAYVVAVETYCSHCAGVKEAEIRVVVTEDEMERARR